MRLWKIIATATVVEVACGAASASVLGLFAGSNSWLDLFNQLAPLWFGLCILAAPSAALLIRPGAGRSVVTGLALVGALISGDAVLPEMAASIGSAFGHSRGVEKPLRIVTFNTWSDNTDPDLVVKRVRDADPDAAALIEMSWLLHHTKLKALSDKYPFRTPARHGCPQDEVLISKRPFTAFGCQITFAPSKPDLMQTVVWGRTTAPDGRPFTLATTHYAWPFPHGGQEMQIPVLAKFVRDHGSEDMILTGDFNLTPWSHTLQDQDRRMRPLTRRDHAIFTWPAMIARVNRPAPFAVLPIDHIYAGSAWRTVRMDRLARAGSDHYGILATFSRRP